MCPFSHFQNEAKFARMSLTSISARHRRTNETGESGLGSMTYCGEGKRYMPYSCQNFNQNNLGIPVCTEEGNYYCYIIIIIIKLCIIKIVCHKCVV